jgi:putative redox protein
MNSPKVDASAHTPIDVNWVSGLAFEAGRPQGPKVRIDGDAQSAPSPFDLLLAAIASCASVDVVTILSKQRTPVHSLSVRVDAKRVESVPRHLAAANLHFRITAPGSTLEKVQRAVELSVTKYCSVRSSLDSEVPVSWTIDLDASPLS